MDADRRRWERKEPGKAEFLSGVVGGDERLVTVELGVAFWQDVDRGEVVFAQAVGEATEPPAQNHHVSGGERERGLRL